MSRGKLEPFDKYYYYHESVQSPEADVKFLRRVYKEYRKALPSPFVMGEDFCGTFAICCAWTKLGKDYVAHGIDLDPEALEYGKTNYLAKLRPHQRERVHVHNKNVLDKGLPQCDVICALNFSFFCFKTRDLLKRYFANVYSRLDEDGVFVVDCFGGSKCQEANEEETEYEDEGFSYFWDQDSFDPVTNEGMFYIHFKRKGEKKREKVFTYDWRLWSIPEIREALYEVGFRQVDVYWEGTDENGEGDGNYTKTESGEECESWVCYITAAK